VNRGLLLAALSGLSLAAAFTGVSHALVAAPASVVAAFGIACLWFALARRGSTLALITAWCIGWCAGAALPGAQPVGAVISRAPHTGQRSDLFALLDEIDARPASMIGRHVRIAGRWASAHDTALASVSQRVMACCAADAIDVGFDVQPAGDVAVSADSSVCVDGTLAARMQDGELRYEIIHATVRASRCSGR
jgi:hypothetical protein